MRVKKTPEKSVHCATCKVDLNSMTMYHRHLTTNAHQLTSREEDAYNAWLTLHKSRIIIIKGSFRMVPTPNQPVSQIPILKLFDTFLKGCNAPVEDVMWTSLQSAFLLMRNQQAADKVAAVYEGNGRWKYRYYLDWKNWVDLTAAKNLTAEEWQQKIEDAE